MNRRQERQLPSVTRAHNPYAAEPEGDTDGTGPASSALNHLPSDEWRTRFGERFRNFRAVRPAHSHYFILFHNVPPEYPATHDRRTPSNVFRLQNPESPQNA